MRSATIDVGSETTQQTVDGHGTVTDGPTVRRSPGLPSGRAVVGAALVGLAVLGLFVSWRQSTRGPTTSYVVAAATIEAGSVIETGHLAARVLDIGDLAAITYTDPDAVVGSVALDTIRPGALIQEASVLPRSDAVPSVDTYEVSIRLPAHRALDATIKAGESVDVVATFSGGDAPCTVLVASRARVGRIGRGDSAVLGAADDLTVTLSVPDPTTVLGIVHSGDESEITLIRSTTTAEPTDAVLPPASYCGPGAGADR